MLLYEKEGEKEVEKPLLLILLGRESRSREMEEAKSNSFSTLVRLILEVANDPATLWRNCCNAGGHHCSCVLLPPSTRPSVRSFFQASRIGNRERNAESIKGFWRATVERYTDERCHLSG